MKKNSRIWILPLVVSGIFLMHINSCKKGDFVDPLSIPATAIWRQVGCYFWQSPEYPSDKILNEMQASKMVILDIELADSDVPKKLKEKNSSILIGIYCNPMEVFTIKYDNRPWQNAVIDSLNFYFDNPNYGKSFYVYNPSHQSKVQYTQGQYPMYLLNLSDDCPAFNGKNYSTWISEMIIDKCFLNKGYINFLFIDNALRDFAWIGAKYPIDINWNRKNDFDETAGYNDVFSHPINIAWRNGITTICNKTKLAFPKFSIIGNGGNGYYGNDLMSGKFFETIDFGSVPGPIQYYGGQLLQKSSEVLYCVDNYLVTVNLSHNIFHFSADNSNNTETALVMALLYPNAYACFGYGSVSISNLMQTDIGNPVSQSYYSSSLKIREFEKAFVVFNMSDQTLLFNNQNIGPSQGRIIMK